MNIQININDNEKNIIIQDDINILELMQELIKLFPKGEWKNFNIKKTVEKEYISNTPIIIDKSPYTPSPYIPKPPYDIDVWYQCENKLNDNTYNSNNLNIKSTINNNYTNSLNTLNN